MFLYVTGEIGETVDCRVVAALKTSTKLLLGVPSWVGSLKTFISNLTTTNKMIPSVDMTSSCSGILSDCIELYDFFLVILRKSLYR